MWSEPRSWKRFPQKTPASAVSQSAQHDFLNSQPPPLPHPARLAKSSIASSLSRGHSTARISNTIASVQVIPFSRTNGQVIPSRVRFGQKQGTTLPKIVEIDEFRSASCRFSCIFGHDEQETKSPYQYHISILLNTFALLITTQPHF